jgi:PAS domain S-box-containing protein
MTYVLSYTGNGGGLTRRRLAILAGLVVPIGGSILFFLIAPEKQIALGIAALVVIAELLFILGIIVYSTYRLVSHSWGHPRISGVQVVLLWIGVGAPYIVGAINEIDMGSATVGFFISGACFVIAVERYPVMTPLPDADYVARTRIIEALEEIVIVLDLDGHILDVNAAAVQAFDRSATAMIGKSVSTLSEELSQRDLSPSMTGNVTLQTVRGRRHFRFSVSVVGETTTTNSETVPVARTVLLRDITDEQTREQRLTVLNRVLRHNARNKLDIIMAHAEATGDEHNQTIHATAKELANYTQKVRDAEESMSQVTDTPEPVDVTAVASDVVQTFRREQPASEISLSCPDELVVTGHQTVLSRALEELVDNAIRHNEGPAPQVEVTVREDNGTAVELSVADDGPGIPQRERRILAEGTETQAEHSLGIGLWFVNWAVRRIGGELTFDKNTPAGSIVTVRLYRSSGR